MTQQHAPHEDELDDTALDVIAGGINAQDTQMCPQCGNIYPVGSHTYCINW